MSSDYMALYECVRDIAKPCDWLTLQRMIVRSAMSLLQTPYGELYLCDGVSNKLVISLSLGDDGLTNLPSGWGQAVAAQAAHLHQPFASHDVDPSKFSHQAALALPLLTSTGLVGVLVIEDATRDGFDQSHVDMLMDFCAVSAGILYTAIQQEHKRNRLSELELESNISTQIQAASSHDAALKIVLNQLVQGLGLSTGSVWLYDQANDELVKAYALGLHTQLPLRTKTTAGLAGWVFTTGQPYIAREFSTDALAPESVRTTMGVGWGGVCVPVRSTGEVIGALLLAIELPREPSPGISQMLVRLVAATDHHNGRRLEPVGSTRQAQRLTSLRTVDTAIMASLDVQLTFNVILDQVMSHLGVSAADILLFDKLTQTLRYAAGRGFHTDGITQASLNLSQDSVKQILSSRRCIVVPDLARSKLIIRQPGLLKGEGFFSYVGVPLAARGQIKGILEIFQRDRLAPDSDWIDFLESLATQAAIAIDNATLFADLQRSHGDLERAYTTTLEGWSKALELRDKETEGHSKRVTETTVSLARLMGVIDEDLLHVRRGALLHDIGKMGTPDSILLKPGPLNDEELIIMRMHPTTAYELLSPITFLKHAVDIPYCHHEKWDGSGYPRGLKCEQIPLWARMFAIVDVWDALISDRPYRKAWPVQRVRDYILTSSGSHFDPDVVKAFLSLIDQ